jgi:hypothetical protein
LSLQSTTTSAPATSSASRSPATRSFRAVTSMRGLMPATRSARRHRLRLAERRDVVGDLPLQIGEVDPIAVDERDPADPGRAEEEGHRRAEPARADHQGVCRGEPRLALDADVVEQEVARVAQQVVVGHVASLASRPSS